MINRSRLSIALKLILVIANLCLVVIYLSGWTNPQVQSNKKMIVRPRTLVKQPLEISFEHRGQLAKPNEEFEGDADWLGNLTLKVKNNTNKAITYVLLDLYFYAQAGTGEDQQPTLGLHTISLGVDPDRKVPAHEFHLAPNESVEIPLAARYKDIKTLVEFRRPVEQVNQMVVRIHDVLFDDGTLFEVSTMYRRNPDPNDLHKWIKIEN